MAIRRSSREKPRSLSKQEKLVQWRDCTVVHPHLKQAFNSFFDAIYNPGGASLIFLFGPTGVGKTTLLRQIVKVMLEDHWAIINADSDYIPVAAVEARAPESGSFDWKGYYQSILVSLDGSTMPKWSPRGVHLRKLSGATKVLFLRAAIWPLFENESLSTYVIDA